MSTTETGPEAIQAAEQDALKVIRPEAEYEAVEGDTEGESELDELTREKLAKLRNEARNLRSRLRAAEELAAKSDSLSRALFTARVAATGKVENPAEIPFSADLLDDADALNAAIDAAIADRPYIKARNFAPVGQGEHGEPVGPQDFSMLFR